MVLFTSTVSIRAQIILNDSPSAFVVEENAFTGITIHNTFSTFKQMDVQTDEGIFTEIGAAGYVSSQEVGLPKLPVLRKLISIPEGAQLEIEILSSSYKEYNLSQLGIQNRIIPAQPPVAKNNDNPKFIINKDAYRQNSFLGSNLCNAEIIGTMRGTRIARVDISPVSYNPVSGLIRVYEDVRFKVNFVNADPEATLYLQQKTASPYFKRLNSTFANNLPVVPSREAITQYPVKMVIVSDPLFQEALQPFIAWKVKKGFTIIEAYTNNPEVGTTTNSIKSYLQNLYNEGTPEDPSPTFVLFVGDVAQIPVFTTEHVTDLYYCEYTNDYLPEMYYGRFSAESLTQLQPQIDKTLMYEQYLFPDPAFLGECVMIAGADEDFGPIWANGQINYGTTYYFNEAHGLLSHTYLYPESENSSTQIIQNVSDGVGFANYTAHGNESGWYSPSFTINDIPGLQNDGEYPLMVGNCCQTSMYGTTCFAEELLRAANKGAVGYIGGSNNTYWNEDFYFGVGVGEIVLNPTYEETSLGNYDRAFHDHGEPYEDWYTTMDQLIFAGNLAVTEGSPSMAEYYWEIYCLMGDPSLTIYNSGIPSEMTVTYNPMLPPAAEEFTVTAVPYAFVAISYNGILCGSALADENGVAIVNLTSAPSSGYADIVVTAQNKQPYINSIIVSWPNEPCILLESMEVNDSNGNNNLQADYGENFAFNIALKNVGFVDAEDVNVTISSDCEYLTIRKASENWGNIPAGGTVSLQMVFELLTDLWLPDQLVSPILLTITSDTNTWTEDFNLVLNAPKLVLNSLIIDDSQSPISNGRLEAGEHVSVKVPIFNEGHSDAVGSFTYLFTDNTGAVLSDNAFFSGNITCNNTAYALFDLTVSDTVSQGSWFEFYISSNANPYFITRSYQLPVSQVVEDFESGDFTAFEWQNNSTYPWTTSPMIANTGHYSAKSGSIGHNMSTELSITMNVPSDDVIIFARKVSSEEGYDFLIFSIDGSQKDSWSGQLGWQTVSYPVTAGNHTFTWKYSKNQFIVGGADAAYIDDVIFPTGNNLPPVSPFAAHSFSYPPTACESQETNLFAFAVNNTEPVSYEWQPSGFLNDNTIYNPIATVNAATEFTVSVTSGSTVVTDLLNIDVNPAPEAPVITQQDDILVSSVAEGNQWYNSNGAIEGANQQSFEPEVTDTYYATVSSEEGCISTPSNQIYVEIVDVYEIENPAEFNVFPNPFSNRFNINYSLNSATPVRIRLLNTLGQEVQLILESATIPAGNYHLEINASELEPGIYFINYETENRSILRKLVLLD